MSNKIQYAEVEQPFGTEPPIVYCPICGQATMKMVDGQGKVNPCLHLSFIYTGMVNEFVYMSDKFEKEINSIDMDEDEKEDLSIKELLYKTKYGNKLLALEITYGGMGGGPIII